MNSPFDFALLVQSPVSQLPRYSDRAESNDRRGEEELDDVEGVVPGAEGTEAHADVETLALGAVVVLKKVLFKQQIPCGEKNQNPEAEGDPESVAQAHLVDAVPRVDDLHVTVDGHGREEEDAGRAVGRQQKEQHAAGDVAVEPVLPASVVVGPEREAEQHDGVRHGQVGQVHRVGLPCVHVKDEHPQSHNVSHQAKHELQDQDGRKEPVQQGRLEGAAFAEVGAIHPSSRRVCPTSMCRSAQCQQRYIYIHHTR